MKKELQSPYSAARKNPYLNLKPSDRVRVIQRDLFDDSLFLQQGTITSNTNEKGFCNVALDTSIRLVKLEANMLERIN